jgi:hypothetical protein
MAALKGLSKEDKKFREADALQADLYFSKERAGLWLPVAPGV